MTTRSDRLDHLQGRCLCGAVEIAVNGEHETAIGACHCRMCQRWAGGIFFCFNAAAQAVSVRGAVQRYRSSPFAERAFCPACGSHLWFQDVGPDGTLAPDAKYELAPGLFDAVRDWPLRSEIYIDRAMRCARLSGDHVRKTRAEYEAASNFVEGD